MTKGSSMQLNKNKTGALIIIKKYMEEKFNVCVVGAGTAGMGVVYGLIKMLESNEFVKSGTLDVDTFKILLIERQTQIGGTAVNAWVQTWIEGINPPYFKEILGKLNVKEEDIMKSVLPPKYRKDKKSGNLYIESNKLRKEYEDFLEKHKNICVRTQTTISSVSLSTSRNNIIDSIEITDFESTKSTVKADYFIDSTGDGTLCRMAGASYYIGEDPYERFREDLMKGITSSEENLNEPSLFYNLGYEESPSDEKLLKKVHTVYKDTKTNKIYSPSYLSLGGYANRAFCNPMTGLGYTGYQCITNEYDTSFAECKKRILEHWKLVKLTLQDQSDKGKKDDIYCGGYNIGQRKCNYTNKHAPMLGIRESYRIKCRYMLRQSDLLEKIDSNDLKDYIACGSHDIDLHVKGNISHNSIDDFNKIIEPSGIPFRSLMPEGLDNVLIACRAYGASHIALSARRVNKDMAQLGWAAGCATILCIARGLEKYSDLYLHNNLISPHIEELQRITGFKSNVKEILEHYNK